MEFSSEKCCTDAMSRGAAAAEETEQYNTDTCVHAHIHVYYIEIELFIKLDAAKSASHPQTSDHICMGMCMCGIARS